MLLDDPESALARHPPDPQAGRQARARRLDRRRRTTCGASLPGRGSSKRAGSSSRRRPAPGQFAWARPERIRGDDGDGRLHRARDRRPSSSSIALRGRRRLVGRADRRCRPARPTPTARWTSPPAATSWPSLETRAEPFSQPGRHAWSIPARTWVATRNRIRSPAMFYDDDADLTSSTARPSPSSASAPRATPTPGTSRTPASTSSSACARARLGRAGQGRRPRGHRARRGRQPRRHRDAAVPDEKHRDVYEERDPRRHRPRQPPDVRPRLLDPLRRGRAAAGRRRRARRAEGPRPPRAPPVPRGHRRPRPDRRPPGRDRQRAADSRSPTPRASAARAAA